MQELVNALLANGFTQEEAQSSIETIVNWVKEHYPIAGGALTTWFNSEG